MSVDKLRSDSEMRIVWIRYEKRKEETKGYMWEWKDTCGNERIHLGMKGLMWEWKNDRIL